MFADDTACLAKHNNLNELISFAELGTRFFLRFALALSHSLAELFALALLRSFLGLKFRAFAFALSRSRAH
jgi:hypothetical protein